MRHEDAIADFNKAIELKPDIMLNPDSNLAISEKLSWGDMKTRSPTIDKAIQLNPGMVEVFSNRAISKAELGRDEDAIADYDKLIELNPFLFEVYTNRAISQS